MIDAPFETPREHLDAELAWLDMVLWFMVQRFHEHDPDSSGQGWYLSRGRVESWLLPRVESEDARQITSQLRASRAAIDGRCAASADAGIALPLASAGTRLGLSAAERLCLLVCLAAEQHPKYSRTYAYLHDNLTRTLPSLGLIEDLARACDLDGGPAIPLSSNLWRWPVVVASELESSAGNRMNHGLHLDASLRAYFLADGALPHAPRDVHADADTVQRIAAFAGRPGRKLIVELYGPAAADGRSIAASVAASLGLPLFAREFHAACRHDALTRSLLEALVRGSALFAGGLSCQADDVQRGVLDAAEPLLGSGPHVVFLQLDKPWFPSNPADNVDLVPFELQVPQYQQRLRHWSTRLERVGIGTEELAGIASRYRLSLTEIDAVVRSARTAAELRSGAGASPNLTDLATNCRLRSRGALGSRAHLITPKQSWDSLVLPPDSLTHLREICGQVRQRARVLHDWGFDARLSTGRGLYVLFAGPSGTGKTLAAEVIARELDVELLRVDLSGVISKYIGETEKNLERVFEVAERTDAILFFDEADALFGKRSEVKDAHDRYANIEVNFLLQRLETFEGAAILATNFVQNIDQAFTRRIHITVEFPFPDEDSRLAIWRNHLPGRTPVSDSVDLPFMARHFEIAGGSIRNVVLNAAFLAADTERSLGMNHLLQAMRREYEKIGKPYRQREDRAPVASGQGQP
jgi:hypothetical protein